MTRNGCISYYQVPIKYELKLPSEATPTSLAIQNQIQAVWHHSKTQKDGYAKFTPNFAFKGY